VDILISITTRKSIHADVVRWMLLQQTKGYVIDIVNTNNPLGHARNQQVLRFLDSPYSYIFILDSDCTPQNKTLEALRAFDLPFVSAPHPYPTPNPGETGSSVIVMDKEPDGTGYIQHYPFDKGLQECDAVGCAGMLINRSVFAKIDQPYFRFIYDSQGLLIKGEDFDFCDRIKEAGIKVYAYCNMVQKHYVEVAV